MSPQDGGPHLPLDEFRQHGHYLIDWIADYLEGIEERPVTPSVRPGDIRAKIPTNAPDHPDAMKDILGDLDKVVMPGITHWQHPGWFAYFPASSSPAAILGEIASAGLAVQGMLWSTSPAVTEVESAVMDWLVDLLGLPTSWRTDTGPGGGVLQMSASDGTHTALVVAREIAIAKGASRDDAVAYTSSQAHFSVEKGAWVAGYKHVRLVDVDSKFAMDPEALATQIAADKAAGLSPAFVCSAIGTTGTTAVDPVRAVGELAKANDMWHHVDAAYAGSAMICPEMRHYQDGLELVDSYVFNPHKWLLTNFDCSAFFVADRSPLLKTMTISAPYLQDGPGEELSSSPEAQPDNSSSSSPSGSSESSSANDSGSTSDPGTEVDAVIDYRDWHVPLGRRFRALKLWFVLRSYGADGLQAYIRAHLAWAQELHLKIEADERLEIVADTTFALVCFRHVDGDGATKALTNAINADGSAYVTPSTINGAAFIRVSIGATWTEKRHVDALWDAISSAAAPVD